MFIQLHISPCFFTAILHRKKYFMISFIYSMYHGWFSKHIWRIWEQLIDKYFNDINSHNLNSEYIDSFIDSVFADREQIISLFKINSQLLVLSLNIGYLYAKNDQLRIFIDEFDELSESNIYFPIICVQETWLSDESDTSSLQLHNYTFVCKGESCSEHGGLGFFYR